MEDRRNDIVPVEGNKRLKRRPKKMKVNVVEKACLSMICEGIALNGVEW